MTKFEELLANSKNQINALITKESKSEEIERISNISKGMDDLLASYNEATKEIQSLKEIIVKQVNNQGSSKQDDDETTGAKQKTLDEIIIEQGNKIISERKK